jgi:hypothetical protein
VFQLFWCLPEKDSPEQRGPRLWSGPEGADTGTAAEAAEEAAEAAEEAEEAAVVKAEAASQCECPLAKLL